MRSKVLIDLLNFLGKLRNCNLVHVIKFCTSFDLLNKIVSTYCVDHLTFNVLTPQSFQGRFFKFRNYLSQYGALLKKWNIGSTKLSQYFFLQRNLFFTRRLIFQLKNCFKQSLNKIAWKIFSFIIRIDTEWTLFINKNYGTIIICNLDHIGNFWWVGF
jgi:hypothetical protein